MRAPVFIAAFMVSSSGLAADFAIGNMPITLGDEKGAVLKEAQSRFHVVPVAGNPDMFFFSERKPPNVHVIGGVTFANGKLASAQRNWGAFDGRVPPIEISKALFAALEYATSQSGEQAVVSTKVQRIPGAEFKFIYFDFPGRKVYITSTDGKAEHGGKSVSIEEAVHLQK